MAQKNKERKSKVNIHYLKILNLWSCLFKKIICKLQYSQHVCGHVWPCAYTEQQKVELLHVHTCSWGLNAYCFAFFFHHSHLKQVASLWSSAPCICIFFVGGFALKMFPEHGIEVISSVPKHKKSIIHLMEEISW